MWGFYCSDPPCWSLASGQCDMCHRRLCHEHKVRRGQQVMCAVCDHQQLLLQAMRDTVLRRGPVRGGKV